MAARITAAHGSTSDAMAMFTDAILMLSTKAASIISPKFVSAGPGPRSRRSAVVGTQRCLFAGCYLSEIQSPVRAKNRAAP
jgi:hypothetical protein